MKPCPACKTKKIRVFRWDSTTIYCECLNPECRMSGPLRANDEAAIKAWDKLPRGHDEKV